jgi:hypothetical protein
LNFIFFEAHISSASPGSIWFFSASKRYRDEGPICLRPRHRQCLIGSTLLTTQYQRSSASLPGITVKQQTISSPYRTHCRLSRHR